MALLGEVGWQGYEGYYFTTSLVFGSRKVIEEDNSHLVIDDSNHLETSVNQWKSAKSVSGGVIGFGWGF